MPCETNRIRKKNSNAHYHRCVGTYQEGRSNPEKKGQRKENLIVSRFLFQDLLCKLPSIQLADDRQLKHASCTSILLHLLFFIFAIKNVVKIPSAHIRKRFGHGLSITSVFSLTQAKISFWLVLAVLLLFRFYFLVGQRWAMGQKTSAPIWLHFHVLNSTLHANVKGKRNHHT